jgi:hypothetical protein
MNKRIAGMVWMEYVEHRVLKFRWYSKSRPENRFKESDRIFIFGKRFLSSE